VARVRALALLSAAGLLLGVPAAAGTGSVATQPSLDTEIVEQVNALRERLGLKPLRLSTALTSAAAYHSRSMLVDGFFDHDSPSGAPFGKRIRRFYTPRGFRSWEVGENLAWGSPVLDAEDVIEDWLASPRHRANLLADQWREVGVSSIRAQQAPGEFGGLTVTVVTVDFGARD